MIPVAPGITPGSGPGHLGLFGYDPLEFQVGRGVIEALGLGVELKPGDVCARANFCHARRQRASSPTAAPAASRRKPARNLCALLAAKIKKIGDTEVIIKAGKEHRFVVVFRGKGLEGPLTDADPNREGFAIPTVKPRDPKNAEAEKNGRSSSRIFTRPRCRSSPRKSRRTAFSCAASRTSRTSRCSRSATSSSPRAWRFIRCTKGLAQLVGMKKIEGPQTIAEQFERYLEEYDNYDFFFIHYKYTDKYGEDGNFAAKKKAIEEFDAALPILLQKKPDVLVVTGDHSTPCALKGHSWHPQPVMLHSAASGSDKLERFTETGANSGSLGIFAAKFLIRLMQANARMFDKFGA